LKSESLKIWLSAALLVFCGIALAKAQNISISVLQNDIPAGSSAKEILEKGNFEPIEGSVPNFENTDEAKWVKVDWQPDGRPQYLIVDNPTIDSLSFYQFNDGKLVEQFKTGDNYNYRSRDLDHPKFIFELNNADASSEILLRLRSVDQLFVPIEIVDNYTLTSHISRFNLVKGLYYGIILVMFLYNFVIAFITKDVNYFIYSFFILALGLAQASLDGFVLKYFLPNAPLLFNHGVIFFSALGGILGSLFALRFLQVKQFAPRFASGLYVLMISYFLAWVFDLLGMKNVSNLLLNVNGLTIGIYVLILAGFIATKGYRPANFYLIAYISLVLGLLIYVFRFMGVVPINFYTNNSLAMGNAAQIILLSIALADRINLLRKEKEESQAEALRVSRENERIIREQNQMLEQKVDERTLELQEANEELTVTLSNLRDTQTQLVDAEKMASLGQLTAGIAHEINNPINFVTSNIKPLRRDIDELYELIDTYSEINPENPQEGLAKAVDLKEELDYDYLKEEVESLVQGITDGANRTSEIVKGLRTFSRLDEDVIKLADIHEGLNSTMVLLRSKTKDGINVEKQYDAEKSEIECLPGKLNQVFMNMINNAIYAVNHKTYQDGEKPTVTLRTSGNEESINIVIADNGIGMTEETKKKMFDPFYTTKEVGEGTGLGMSIVYKIIEKHRGSLEVKSELGAGTEFIINLPVRQPNEFE